MSNKTDLDWLARNVHVWPCGKHQPWCYVVTKIDGERTWASNVLSRSFPYSLVDKDQWIARRAELQNKPSWADAPEWATHLAQASVGNWFFFSGEPYPRETAWHILESMQAISLNWKGEVLGDWRDTLEKRPEEFQPFTSIEDNQEKVMAQQQEMKQDNGWLERGELPPVGVECEMKRIDGRWCKAVTVGKDSSGRMVCELNDNGVFYASTSSAESFRPIRTERDVLADLIESHGQMSALIVADAIIAAGFKLEAK